MTFAFWQLASRAFWDEILRHFFLVLKTCYVYARKAAHFDVDRSWEKHPIVVLLTDHCLTSNTQPVVTKRWDVRIFTLKQGQRSKFLHSKWEKLSIPFIEINEKQVNKGTTGTLPFCTHNDCDSKRVSLAAYTVNTDHTNKNIVIYTQIHSL